MLIQVSRTGILCLATYRFTSATVYSSGLKMPGPLLNSRDRPQISPIFILEAGMMFVSFKRLDFGRQSPHPGIPVLNQAIDAQSRMLPDADGAASEARKPQSDSHAGGCFPVRRSRPHLRHSVLFEWWSRHREQNHQSNTASCSGQQHSQASDRQRTQVVPKTPDHSEFDACRPCLTKRFKSAAPQSPSPPNTVSHRPPCIPRSERCSRRGRRRLCRRSARRPCVPVCPRRRWPPPARPPIR